MLSANKADATQVRFRELEDILEQMPVGVAIAEMPTGKLIFHNREAVHLLRHPMLPVSDFNEYLRYHARHPDGNPYATDEYPIVRALRGETVGAEEMTYIRGDGTETRFLVNAAPVKDAGGAIVKAVCTFYDISERKQSREALAASRRRLIDALRGGDLILWDLDLMTAQIEYAGDTLRLLGYRQSDLPADLDGWLDLVHPDDRALFQNALARHIHRESPGMEAEYRVRTRDGTWKWFVTRGKGRRINAAGQMLRIAGSHLDITERKQAELLLKETETKLRLTVEIAEIGFWEWNIESGAVYFSPYWKQQLGYQDHQIPDRIEEWESRLHPADRQRVINYLRAYLRQPSGDYQIEMRFRHRNGSYRWIQSRAQALRNEQGQALRMIGTHLDITDHKEREEQVRLFAQHDRLTKLPNRALTLESAERWLSAAQRTGDLFAVLYVDLDEFKPINDIYGHHIGDEVLKEVALRLKGSFRSHDIVGRLGGDEFLVMVTQLENTLSAAHAAMHALHELGLPYRIGNLALHTSPSIGISIFPQDGTDIDTLVRHADTAMYQAKQSGKGTYRFFAKPQSSLPESPSLEASLRASLLSNRLQLYFQPMIDTSSRHLIAVEALLRWPTSQGKHIPPDVFIPVAERSDLILGLGEWVLRAACAQHRQWLNDGLPPIHVGINLSAIQFRESDLLDCMTRGLNENSIDPCFLSVEISDRVFTGNMHYITPILEQLKALGIRITLDDFGAGYSSLEKLSRLPLDRVKIDRSLIMSLPNNRRSIAVTAAAISFGNSLDIEVIAEGLESEQVLAFLEAHDCHLAQGFYLAKPMPGPQFVQWYRQAGLR